MPREMVSRSHARKLNREIHEGREREVKLGHEIDRLHEQLAAAGKALGCANQRLEQIRQIADTALHGFGIIAAATNNEAQIRTCLSLQRDGRTQLARALNGNGAQA